MQHHLMQYRCRGLSLLEVLITSSMLGSCALGLLAMQTHALSATLASSQRQTASLLLMDLSERIYAAPDAFRRLDITATEDVIFNSSAASLVYAQEQWHAWQQQVYEKLPEASLEVKSRQHSGGLVWLINLSWYGPADSAFSSIELVL